MARTALFLFAYVLLSVGPARAGSFNSVSVNGSCDVGTCDFTNPVPYNTNLTETFSVTTTFGNGDTYSIAGTAIADNNGEGTYLPEGVDYQVTYLGDGQGGASQADTVNVNILVAFETTLGPANFGAGDFGYVGGGLGTGSTAYYSGYGPTLQGPFSAPGPFNADYIFGLSSVSGALDFTITSQSNFAAGSAVGSAIVYGAETAPTPEPVTFILMGGALVVLSRLRRR